MDEPKSYLLAEIAAHVQGELISDVNTRIDGIATLANAGPVHLSFLTNSRHRRQLSTTKAAAVLLAEDDRNATQIARIVCADPYLAYAKAAALFVLAENFDDGIHTTAVVHAESSVGGGTRIGAFCAVGKGAAIGRQVSIGPGCTIGQGVVIGDHCTIHANVSIYPGCRIGSRAIIHSGAVLGSDGFGMAKDGDRWRKIPQLGGVLIGDDVEIGANTTVDRGALEDTVLEDGVKLDNQIQIGHNVHIGAHSAFAGCVGVAGSAKIGRRCTIGGGSVILGHLEIVDDVHIGAASVVTKSIGKPGAYTGLYPLQEHARWAKNAVLLRNLDQVSKHVQALEKELHSLKKSEQ